MTPYYADLHAHTVLSDGNDTPAELIDAASQARLSVVGLTDHDVLPPQEITVNQQRVSLEEYAARKGVRVLRGVEFSCETNIEDAHIIGFFCDFAAAPLRALEREIKQSKTDAYIELLKRLTERGMAISLEELLARHPGMTADTLQKKLIFDLMAKKGYAPTWKDAKLLVRQDPALAIKRAKPEALRVLSAIRQSGGRAILAHPFLIDPTFEYEGKKTTRWDFIDLLIANGLYAIERRYPYGKTTCFDKRADEELWDEIERRYRGALRFSAGSDYHNDAKAGTKNPRLLGECGLTEEEFRRLFD